MLEALGHPSNCHVNTGYSPDGWGDMRKWLKSNEKPWGDSMDVDLTTEAQIALHMSTRLLNGRVGLLVDPGSKGNAAGAKWCDEMLEKVLEEVDVVREVENLIPQN